MKHLIIILVILAIVLSSIFTEQFLVNSIFDELYLRSTKCLEEIKSEEVLGELEKLDDWWHEKRRILCAVISHNDIKDIDNRFPLIIEYLRNGNIEDSMAELKTVIHLSRTVPAAYRLAPENVL